MGLNWEEGGRGPRDSGTSQSGDRERTGLKTEKAN